MLNLEKYVANVNNTFIELFLKEVIYIKALPRVDIPARQCLKINQSLYSLKQAARDQNKTYIVELQRLGFIQLDSNLYLLTYLEQGIILLVYVNNILLGVKKLENIRQFIEEFSKVFKIKDLSKAKKILSVRIT